jgi:hypothetical protein
MSNADHPGERGNWHGEKTAQKFRGRRSPFNRRAKSILAAASWARIRAAGFLSPGFEVPLQGSLACSSAKVQKSMRIPVQSSARILNETRDFPFRVGCGYGSVRSLRSQACA